MRLLVFLALMLALAMPLVAQQDTLTLVTHDSFNVSEAVLAKFEDETGFTVQILRSGDAGQMVNQSILSLSNPLGDVLFGVDNTFLSRALDNDLFLPYESPMLEYVPDAFVIDDEYRVTPIDYGDVCLNYDVSYFAEHDVPLPENLADLTDPVYEGLLVVENPATSSPGLAFLLATVGAFGTEGDYTWLDFWADLVENQVKVVSGWETAYFGDFSGSAGSEGVYPLVVSYASSPPAEVFFMEEPPESAPTGAIVTTDTCFRQIEFAGILNGTLKVEAAQQFIDFMLSVDFQEDVPLQMFVFPVNMDADLPEIFVEYTAIPDELAQVDFADIDANREAWIQAWTETVLR